MAFDRFQAVKFLLALLLLCACAPGRAMIDSNTGAKPIYVPSYTPALPTAQQNPSNRSDEFFQGPLSVVIQSPADNAVVQVSPVELKGQANPDTVITFNEVVILVDEKRDFIVLLDLEPGENLIEITASDLEGNQDFAYLTLLYEP